MTTERATVKNALAVQDQPAAHPVTPMQMLALAVERGTSIEQLTQLMALQERWEANEARKAFVAALNAFKSDPPTILKNKDVAFGNTAYSHATLDHVSRVVGESLSKHGLAHRWNVEQTEGRIKVACILTHVLGHSESVSMESGADTSGSKNPIQAIASAVTYLQRYTLLAATGMAAGGTDDDGAGTTATMNEETEQGFMRQIELATTKEYLLSEVWKKAADACKAIPDPEAHKRLKTAVMEKAKTFKDKKGEL